MTNLEEHEANPKSISELLVFDYDYTIKARVLDRGIGKCNRIGGTARYWPITKSIGCIIIPYGIGC